MVWSTRPSWRRVTESGNARLGVLLATLVLLTATFVVVYPNVSSRVSVANAQTIPVPVSVTTHAVPHTAPTSASAASSAADPAEELALANRLAGAVPAKAVHSAPVVAPVQAPATTAAANNSASAGSYGCGPALAYLRANAAPGFTLECPGNAFGNQAMTCINHAPQCPGAKVIAIAVPCAAAYMNEAHNSWVLTGQAGTIDPYGYCH